MRRPYLWARQLAFLGPAFVLSCSAPEDSNPALRCDETTKCPGTLECYRGFCIDGDGDELSPVSSITPADASSVSVQAPKPSSLSDAGAAWADAASDVIIQDSPGGPVVVVDAAAAAPVASATPEPIIATPAPLSPAPVVTPTPTPAPTTPVITSIACAADCALGAESKSCKDCFKTSFGDQPDRVCEQTAILSVELAALCNSLCVTAKGHGSASCSQAALSCRGAGCGGP